MVSGARHASRFDGHVSLFCRHNRFVAECPICSKGTVLDPNRKPERARASSASGRRPGAGRPVQAAGGARVSRGHFAAAGPYDGGREVRLGEGARRIAARGLARGASS